MVSALSQQCSLARSKQKLDPRDLQEETVEYEALSYNRRVNLGWTNLECLVCVFYMFLRVLPLLLDKWASKWHRTGWNRHTEPLLIPGVTSALEQSVGLKCGPVSPGTPRQTDGWRPVSFVATRKGGSKKRRGDSFPWVITGAKDGK